MSQRTTTLRALALAVAVALVSAVAVAVAVAPAPAVVAISSNLHGLPVIGGLANFKTTSDNNRLLSSPHADAMGLNFPTVAEETAANAHEAADAAAAEAAQL
jgi:hypothetical protein